MFRRKFSISTYIKPDTKPTEHWDINWKPSDGKLSNLGFVEHIDQAPATAVLSDEGLMLTAGGGNVFYDFPESYYYMKKGVLELDITPYNTSCNYNDRGFRFRISTAATKGLPCNIANGRLLCLGIQIALIENNSQYTIRVEYDESVGSKIYLNGKIIYETNRFQTEWVDGTRIFQQTGGQTLIRGIRVRREK